MGAAFVASLAGAGLFATLPAGAQDAPAAEAEAPATEFDPKVVEQGFRIWKTKIVCGECHGWSGNGVPDNPRQPVGANLRETTLNHEQLVEVIKCGRPGTGMPHFDQRAYKDDRCFGVTAEDLGDQTPPGWGASLIPREIEAVTVYIEAKQKGRGPFTFAECEEYFGSGAQICVTYESNRGAAAPVSQPPRQGGAPH
jgi:cytochrome c553